MRFFNRNRIPPELPDKNTLYKGVYGESALRARIMCLTEKQAKLALIIIVRENLGIGDALKLAETVLLKETPKTKKTRRTKNPGNPNPIALLPPNPEDIKNRLDELGLGHLIQNREKKDTLGEAHKKMLPSKRINKISINKLLVFGIISLIYWNFVPIIVQENASIGADTWSFVFIPAQKDASIEADTSDIEGEIIAYSFSVADKNVSKYVISFDVMDDLAEVCPGENKPGMMTAGCINIRYSGTELTNASIYVIPIKKYPKDGVCQFEHTVLHEWGHLDEAYNGVIDDGESYAEDYANRTTRC